ncbi:hypothetical protein EIP91_000352 [Steccherinum ochraceum]|uniref:Uncharacterized protein n=1 Tax=Steccherinum ochraceum TaxID=92696 RepID=A0A4R0RK02_9APHY|nr:hypothetical protein EIP91_000352 [Steccherinum ochraceum]
MRTSILVTLAVYLAGAAQAAPVRAEGSDHSIFAKPEPPSGRIDFRELPEDFSVEKRGLGRILEGAVPAVIGAAGALGSASIFMKPEPASGTTEKRQLSEDLALEKRGLGRILEGAVPAVIGAAGALGSASIFTKPEPASGGTERRELGEDLLELEKRGLGNLIAGVVPAAIMAAGELGSASIFTKPAERRQLPEAVTLG